jgi:DNA polymerase III subunit delta
VLNVARYDTTKLLEAIWTGQVGRALRVLDGLQHEGESAPGVHWMLADDLRAIARGRAALDGGKPLPLALKDARVWGVREKLLERVLPQLTGHQAVRLLEAASICDGICKGLKHPAWPFGPWEALQRLVLMMAEAPAAVPAQAGMRGLALRA